MAEVEEVSYSPRILSNTLNLLHVISHLCPISREIISLYLSKTQGMKVDLEATKGADQGVDLGSATPSKRESALEDLDVDSRMRVLEVATCVLITTPIMVCTQRSVTEIRTRRSTGL